VNVVSVAVCPHPPLLVPELAGAASSELDSVRSACSGVVVSMLSADPTLVLVLGAGPETLSFSSADSGSFAGYGLELRVGLGPAGCAGRPLLPLSLTIGGWLLAQAGWSGDRQGFAIATAGELAAAAEQIAELPDRVGLLVMGDGAVATPPLPDGAARAFDAGVAAALAGADTTALAGLDLAAAAELCVAGALPWALLGRAAAGADWHGEVLAQEAPYGVGYLVARWWT
jgi:hypothetical protein